MVLHFLVMMMSSLVILIFVLVAFGWLQKLSGKKWAFLKAFFPLNSTMSFAFPAEIDKGGLDTLLLIKAVRFTEYQLP